MFIEEQCIRSVYDLKPELIAPCVQTYDGLWAAERHFWSPVSCRHTNWTYRPLIINNKPQRDPFVLAGA